MLDDDDDDNDDDDDDRVFVSFEVMVPKIPFILRHRKVVEVKEENLAGQNGDAFFAREVKRFSNKLKGQQQHQNLKLTHEFVSPSNCNMMSHRE